MGGTLDIKTFSYPLRRLAPCTVNTAVDLRTRVGLGPAPEGLVKVTSRGFAEAAFALDVAPFDHPLGLIFAVASYFDAGGVHIDIDSASPPRSALGGSSAAAVALVAALAAARARLAGRRPPTRPAIVRLAHALEESVAGVPCGMQDQLAAAYGGVHAWFWTARVDGAAFKRRVVVGRRRHRALERRILLAYGGNPHSSRQINSRWVQQFLAGEHRERWRRIAACVHAFAEALSHGRWGAAVEALNRESGLRVEMTPDVYDATGQRLVEAALAAGCGARFTGAGGGGCIWALGSEADIIRLRETWGGLLASVEGGRLLDFHIAPRGLEVRWAEQPEA
jgi:D-glycero-alpha-D-manno-heptose-7-phosphate kinase